MKYSISEVAEIMGVPASTIRFYDKEGLLPNIKRESEKRVFTDDDFKWLKVLNCLRNIGMPLKKIREYVELAEEGDSSLKEFAELLKVSILTLQKRNNIRKIFE